jgi:hypothetical protein
MFARKVCMRLKAECAGEFLKVAKSTFHKMASAIAS